MASSSPSSSPQNWRYRVFTSFHGPDVRKLFLSHLSKQFSYNGISMFNDQEIERSQTIAPSLTKAIRESRISIVVLSKNYASSAWCLDELLEILKCKEDIGQIVMTVFYGVDPSHVRNQTGEFGSMFNQTCARRTEEERRRWSQALKVVGNIAGEHLLKWENEAKMIEKIARDVSDKLVATTPSNDFDGMVGLEPHLLEMKSLLDLDNDGVKIVGIYGPAGIGKTTIARALQSLISNRFQLTCFVENLRGSYHSGLDDYGLKLRLQEHLLSKILNHNEMRIGHLGVIQDRLCDMKVLIVLDDVDDLKQLEALADETNWFGPGSRVVVTTEDQEILVQHGIDITYHVGFPSREEALNIFSRYTFRQSTPSDGFEKLAKRVTELCSYLPLGLRVMSSSLRGKDEDEWEVILHRLEISLDRDIERVLKIGYDSLDENEQILFLHIAVFFNYNDGELVKDMFVDSNVDVKTGLKILVNRSLISITGNGEIVMHRLLQQVGRKAIQRQKPWERQILIDAHEICHVLENDTGTGVVSGIWFDTSNTKEVFISKRALTRMPNLRFLKVYKRRYDGNDRMHIPVAMEFPHRLRLLHWEAYPSKCLPPTFHPEYLVELDMKYSQVEKLWDGTQPLTSLKKLDLSASYHLKVLPDLSKAINLETLKLGICVSLVEIPSSCSQLHKVQKFWLSTCNQKVIPAHLSLASLEYVFMRGFSKLRNILVISTHIKKVDVSNTELEDVPASVTLWSGLRSSSTKKSGMLKEITHHHTSVTELALKYTDIARIPDSIKALHGLQHLIHQSCRSLESMPKLPGSHTFLRAEDCESLETVFCPLYTPNALLSFDNCFKLGQQPETKKIQQSSLHGSALLLGSEVPAAFHYRAKGSSLTILPDVINLLSAFSRFKICLVVSPNHQTKESSISKLLCRTTGEGDLFLPIHEVYVYAFPGFRTEHLFIFYSDFLEDHIKYPGFCREIVFEFSSIFHDFDVIECGAQIWTKQSTEGSNKSRLNNQVVGYRLHSVTHEIESSDSSEDESDVHVPAPRSRRYVCDSNSVNIKRRKYINCWSLLMLCCDLSSIVRTIRRFVSGR
ncbi:PREDICTED: disease resistance protein RML1B-like [Camelina sativa]|uniref:ADP-ribosyl cyclase/cyclic ADP-ribose hydrolase n=1 Tax=Camelina sativa TaxID=90675 RepID=A0ABM0X867_CAMSA|nr:PREDICTED: disease resistance protein RML1B-like [Camelina sativa]